MEPIKYPRTFHLPWSESKANDDKVLSSLAGLAGQEVVVTEKMDGENTTLMADTCYARSLDSVSHFTRDWVRAFWASIRHELPPGWRFCGENLYARHAIAYDALRSYYMGFSVWDETYTALPWDEAVGYMNMLNIVPVEVLYRGIFDPGAIRAAYAAYREKVGREVEGYVVRRAGAIPHDKFTEWVGKYVRPNHCAGAPHWLYGGSRIELNRLA